MTADGAAFGERLYAWRRAAGLSQEELAERSGRSVRTVAGRDTPSGVDERAAAYRSLVAGRRLLIVLDNARHAEQVRPLLPGSPGCVTVVTSRDALGGLVAGDGAVRLEVDLLPLAAAVSLLAGLIGSRVRDDPAAAVKLAGHCGRLPLAFARVSLGVADDCQRGFHQPHRSVPS